MWCSNEEMLGADRRSIGYLSETVGGLMSNFSGTSSFRFFVGVMSSESSNL